jgi:hypothetical protein
MIRTTTHFTRPAACPTIGHARSHAYMLIALTTFQCSAIVIRTVIGPLTPLRAPRDPRKLPSPLPLLPPGAPGSAFKFQTPSH